MQEKRHSPSNSSTTVKIRRLVLSNFTILKTDPLQILPITLVILKMSRIMCSISSSCYFTLLQSGGVSQPLLIFLDISIFKEDSPLILDLIVFIIYAEFMHTQIIWEEQKYIESDGVIFSFHHIKKHMMSICYFPGILTFITWLSWCLTHVVTIKLISILNY